MERGAVGEAKAATGNRVFSLGNSMGNSTGSTIGCGRGFCGEGFGGC